MKTDVYSLSGEKQKVIELHDKVFACETSTGSIYHAVRNELANRRQGTAATKTRAMVNGSDRKPWRQKGLGRARAGTRRSPLWRSGGTTFGPQPRDYSYSLPKKLRRLAMRSLLSQKLRDNELIIVEDFTIESAKTKDFVQRTAGLITDKKPVRVVLIVKEYNDELKRATSNLHWLRCLNYARLNAHDLLYSKKVLIVESAAEELCKFYLGESNGT